MKYILDTDTCIYIIKNHPPNVKKKLSRLETDDIVISSIVVAELAFGIACSRRKKTNKEALDVFLSYVLIEDWPVEAAPLYGDIRAHLKSKGTPIGAMDLLIAAHAVHNRSTLVTNNTNEYKRVPKLKIENWVN